MGTLVDGRPLGLLARRKGKTLRELSEMTGLNVNTLNRAFNGGQVRIITWSRIWATLNELPDVPGFDQMPLEDCAV